MSRRDVEEGRKEGERGGIRRRKRRRKGATSGGGGSSQVTLRLVFLITPDPGRAEEELLSDVSIMTRLCTEVHIPRLKKRRRRKEETKGSVYASGHFPPREQGGNRKVR